MTTWDFIIALFYHVDEYMHDTPKHSEAHLWPSEVGTLGLLHALKGVGNRAFYRWLTRDYRTLFPRLPERTRLFRLFTTHQDWTQVFLASPTVLGVIDTYGIALIHPIREGRSSQQNGLPCGGRRSWEPQTLSAWAVERPHPGGNGARDADPRPTLQEGHAPGLDVFPGPARVHHGGLQCPRPVVWLPAQRIWLHTSLHC
jgi:hypothetical protein